jgi:hypothetical protein
LFPNGYNLTEGGKTTKFAANIQNIENNEERKEFKKRGRDFGYVHKNTTKEKMKKYYETASIETMKKKEDTMSKSISEHFNNERAKNLAKSDIELDEKFADLIRPKKKDGKIVSYVIRYKRKQYTNLAGKKHTPQEKYDMLYNALKEAYEIRKKEQQKI